MKPVWLWRRFSRLWPWSEAGKPGPTVVVGGRGIGFGGAVRGQRGHGGHGIGFGGAVRGHGGHGIGGRRGRGIGWRRGALVAGALVVGFCGVSTMVYIVGRNAHNAALMSPATSKGATAGNQRGGAPAGSGATGATSGSHNAAQPYADGPTMPKVIKIPKLGIDARVVRIGLLADGRLDNPKRLSEAGWYVESSGAGEAGAGLIVGHSTNQKDYGAFTALGGLVAGDQFSVERGDGVKFTYRVVKTREFPADQVDMASTLVSVTPGRPGLNLLTCSGYFNSKQESFDKRLVVYTEQVN